MEDDYTEFQNMVDEAFGDLKLSYADECGFMILLNGPEEYGNDDQMLKFYKAHRDAGIQELLDYWRAITPPGLAPGDSLDNYN